MKVTLYAKDQSGNIRVWSIEPDYEMECLIIEHGVLNGEIQTKNEWIDEGKASRTIEEQIDSRMNSRIEKKLKTGYLYSLEEARANKRVNGLGYKKPMTAKKYENLIGKIDYRAGVYAQPKYNGNRCLIYNDGGIILSYSRYGILNNRIDHILDEIDIPEGVCLDGELYCHGEKLQTINSWVKRLQPNTKNLKYMCYDVMKNNHYEHRLMFIQEFLGDLSNTTIADTQKVNSDSEVAYIFKEHQSMGYEGSILRQNEFIYEDGKRSPSLLKVKKIGDTGYIDEEFLVVDITPSKDGWAILHCVTKEGKRFRVAAPGTMLEKYRILKKKDEYIGKYVQIEFPEWTIEGKPFHPVATRFRHSFED